MQESLNGWFNSREVFDCKVDEIIKSLELNQISRNFVHPLVGCLQRIRQKVFTSEENFESGKKKMRTSYLVSSFRS